MFHCKEMFTIAAFDNFYHTDKTSLSGLSSSHDTVSTLFQVKPPESASKTKEKLIQFEECSYFRKA